MARRSGFHRPTQARRLTSWGLGPNAVDISIAATGKQIFTTGVQLANEVRATIVRLRGYCGIYLNSASVVGSGFSGAVGFGIVSLEAFTVGVTAMPGPVDDMEWPGWMFHRFFDLRTITATIGDGVNASACDASFEIDSKAMRKIGANEVFVGMIEVTEQTSAQVEIQCDTRMLVKLS